MSLANRKTKLLVAMLATNACHSYDKRIRNAHYGGLSSSDYCIIYCIYIPYRRRYQYAKTSKEEQQNKNISFCTLQELSFSFFHR